MQSRAKNTALHSLAQLLAQVQLLNDRAVTLDVDLLQVAKKVSSVADHLQHAAAAVVVLVVGLEVLGQSVDAMGKDRDLNLRRAGVALVSSELGNNGLLFVFQHFRIHLSLIYGAPQRWVGECRINGGIPRPRTRHAGDIITQTEAFVKTFFENFFILYNVYEFSQESRSCIERGFQKPPGCPSYNKR